ncbi:hypothetical protein [Clostridium sp. Marseille-Q2269]|uniref:hypothetical protein n=1 Tax=Clostridium sp. Marseille-Q2269 TaxID=2942205 RepID=UPI002072C813|nr:hypothetical protein [Clostridium sp. Marseille-Q2269]
MKINKATVTFLKFVISFIIYKLIIGYFNFSYNLFSDKFSILKLLIDFAGWSIVYLIVHLVFKKLSKREKSR